MRPLPTLLLAAVAAGVAWLWLAQPGAPPPSGPSPEIDRPPPPPADEPSGRPEATTGTLVIRLATADGRPVPDGARAGYAKFGGPPRMRGRGGDGTFRFTDAPVGEIEVMAEVAGYQDAKQRIVVTPGVPAETVILVSPVDATSK